MVTNLLNTIHIWATPHTYYMKRFIFPNENYLIDSQSEKTYFYFPHARQICYMHNFTANGI